MKSIPPADQALDLSLLKRLFAFTKPYARDRNILIGLVILRSLQLPVLAWATGSIIQTVTLRKDPLLLVLAASGFLAFSAFTEFTFCYRMRFALNLGESVIRDLRLAIFRHMLRMPMGYFHRTKVGRIISRFTTDAEAVRAGVQEVLFVSLVQVGQMCGAAVLMAIYDWKLFLAVLGLVPVLIGINRYFQRRLSHAHRESQESFSRITSNLAEAVNGIRVTQGFVREDVNSALFNDLIEDHARTNMRVARTSGMFIPLLELNGQLFIAMLFVLGGYQVLNHGHGVAVGDLIMFLFLSNLFFNPIQSLGNQYNNALTALAGAERLFDFLDAKPDWEESSDLPELPQIEGRVEFDDVWFSYVKDRPALRGVSFTAEAGKTIALVGHTGSGKSSIINLLSKFYQPDRGTIQIDGRDLADVAGESLHRQMGMVLQQNFLFSGTVLDNIRFSKPEADATAVENVLRELGCLSLIQALPEGLLTQVGERGAGVSLGQRQLICFARAMLPNPRLLILDEATSSIDAMTEVVLQTALTRLLHGRTSFLVAHRLSTVRQADLILVLNHGEIIERGSHETLLSLNGTYAQLYRQFVRATTA